MEYAMSPITMPEDVKIVVYAGFWRRYLASWIDGLIALVFTIVMLVLLRLCGVSLTELSRNNHPPLIHLVLGLIFDSILISGLWLYHALMESSPNQGTLGKMALGLRVTDLEGRRITFGCATGRYFAKLLSTITLLIGFIMAAFTSKKQALHDIIAGTLVVRTR
jgi:uncharacterized RDD family membrane protein YckC